MSDSHNERFLSELLREVAQEDAHLDGADLEQRVMARWDRSPIGDAVRLTASAKGYGGPPKQCEGGSFMRRRKPDSTDEDRSRTGYWVIGAIAAAILIAIVVPKIRMADPSAVGTTEVPATPPASVGQEAIPPYPLPLTPHVPTLKSAPAEPGALGHVARRTSTRRPPAPAETETFSFVPLTPMSGEELSGSFQIVRVQMPRASLGALAATVDSTTAGDLVEADVLLGEDGMARAIRVSSNGTAYPWRSR